MNADEVVKALRDWNEQYLSVMCASDCAPQCYEYCDGVDCIAVRAADCIESLQAQLAAEKRRADAAVEDMKRIVDKVRETHCDDTCCFACKYDADFSITEAGDFANECPGFDTNECFEWRGVKEERE